MGSPFHTGSNGSPITWYGLQSYSGLRHVAEEDGGYWALGSMLYNHIYGAGIAQSVLNVQAVFMESFPGQYASATAGWMGAVQGTAYGTILMNTGAFPSPVMMNEVSGCLMGDPAACPGASDGVFMGVIAGDPEYFGYWGKLPVK